MPEQHESDVPFPGVTGYVLAGGQSSRMGRDKAFLRFGGKDLIGIAVNRLEALCSHVRILSGPLSFERDAVLDCYAPHVPDRTAGCGPLGGIDAALTDAPTDWLLVIAVDQAFLNEAMLLPWIGSALSSGCLLSYLSVEGEAQPLPLLLRKELQSGVQQRMREGDRKLLRTLQKTALQSHAGIFEYPMSASAEILRSLSNLNTPADLAGAEEHWKACVTPNQTASDASDEAYDRAGRTSNRQGPQ